MKLGIAVYGHPPAHTSVIVQRAEALGFDIAWLGEHLLAPAGHTTPHPHRPNQDPPVVGLDSELADPLVLIGAIAATTHRIRLATGVFILPLRHPLLAARSVITAQQLAAGRLVLGVGSGWLEEEFDALDVPFAERGSRLDESLDVLQSALRGGVFSHSGAHHRFEPVQLSACAAPTPIVLGGITERALRRAARAADGWYSPSTLSLEDCVALRTRLTAHRAEIGTAARPFSHYVRMPEWPTEKSLARYAGAGFEHVTISGFALWPPDRPLSLGDKLAALERASAPLSAHLLHEPNR